MVDQAQPQGYGTQAASTDEDKIFQPTLIYGGYDPNRYTTHVVRQRRRQRAKQCMHALVIPMDGSILKQLMFHTLNVSFGAFACVVMWSIIMLSILLSPAAFALFPIDNSFYQWLCLLVRGVAEVDIHLYNSISPQGEHIFVSFASPRDLMAAIFYFACVKPLLVVVTSAISLSLLVVSFGLVALSFSPHFLAELNMILLTSTALVFLAGAFSVYISVLMVIWTARRACSSTRYCCCDGLEIYRYVYGIPIPVAQHTPSHLMGFGTGYIV
ncbi:Aste57867_9658 [Aphanomyces stellatus]|uniref:Aste57867_9658 protein n=1 Tax=Aphanomyces stellatus TaxID=120398 RepID=A0A485KP03_9STRA|nr:hypothetical protein As57867_009620 [Aphanomyces stellatus]VFT86537.1 Aste57867_9658 [Aphanomyces stellatus]